MNGKDINTWKCTDIKCNEIIATLDYIKVAYILINFKTLPHTHGNVGKGPCALLMGTYLDESSLDGTVTISKLWIPLPLIQQFFIAALCELEKKIEMN